MSSPLVAHGQQQADVGLLMFSTFVSIWDIMEGPSQLQISSQKQWKAHLKPLWVNFFLCPVLLNSFLAVYLLRRPPRKHLYMDLSLRV